MTGRWPTKVEDLSHTSLPAHSYVWRQTANSIVFLWPQNLDPEAQNNRDVALAYWKGGLFNSFGRGMGLLGRLAHGTHQEEPNSKR